MLPIRNRRVVARAIDRDHTTTLTVTDRYVKISMVEGVKERADRGVAEGDGRFVLSRRDMIKFKGYVCEVSPLFMPFVVCFRVRVRVV